MIGQKSKNFTWIILVDPSLPGRYLKRLKMLVRDHPNISILRYSKSMDLNNADFIEKHFRKISSDYLITTRLDDDDALSSDFVERLQNDFQKVKTKDLLFISYPKGLHWRPNKKLKHGEFSDTYYESIALGLSLATLKRKYPFTIYGWSHLKIVQLLEEYKIDKKSKLYKLAKASGDKIKDWNMKERLKIIKTRDNIYLRTVHGENDAAKLASKRFFNKVNQKVNLSTFSLNPKMVAKANSILASDYLDQESAR